MEFHISRFPKTDLWPEGGYALYRIDGEDIARQYQFDSAGKVVTRGSWNGYLGCYRTLGEVTAAIKNEEPR